MKTGDNGRLDDLLGELRRQTSRESEPNPQAILDWLHRQIGVELALVSGAGRVELSTADFPHDILRPLQPMLTRISGGQMAAATTQTGGSQVHLEALGPHLPRPVLVAANSAGLAQQAAALISHTGSVIAMLRRAREADKAARAYQRKANQLRFAVFMALMAGDVALTRRMMTGAVPTLLNAHRVRVHLLYCGSDDRFRLTRTYQDALGFHGPGLMVPCPVFNGHLICLISDDADMDDPGGHGKVPLRLVHDNPHYALGISESHPLHATVEAYGQACHALAVARSTPGRVATYDRQAALDRVLPQEAALTWARAYLRPLDSVSKYTLDIARLATTLTRTGVARLLSISRNTVTAHLRKIEDRLGLDLNDVRCRATLDLALALAVTGRPFGVGSDHGQPAPTLETLLQAPPTIAWAAEFLRPLRNSRHRNLHRTVQTWIDTNTNAQEAAHRLSVSRNTIRAHLRAAEQLLSRDLLTTGSGIHDLVLALSASGDLTSTTVRVGQRSQVTRHPDCASRTAV